MLKLLRKKKNSKIIMLLLGIIIVVFAVSYMGMGDGNNGIPNFVATVDGKGIKTTDYQQLHRMMYEQYKRALQGQVSDEMLEKLDLRQRALDNLISRRLILKEAKRKGINISDAELQTAIQQRPEFQVDGRFSIERYKSLLRANRLEPEDFEAQLHADLIIQQSEQAVTQGLTVTDEEVAQIFAAENRQVNLNYLAVDALAFEKSVTVTDEEAEDYLDTNRAPFRLPTKIKVAYASLFFKDLASDVQVGATDIKEYYEQNIETFDIPKEVRASHILIRLSPSDDDGGKSNENARKKAGELLDQINKGKDFVALAKKHSEDPGSGKRGGDLGYFKAGDMVESFEDAAFSLAEGETSDIVESSFGYHIIRVTDIKEERTLPLEEAKDDIVKVLASEGAKELARERMNSLQLLFDDEKPLDEIKEAAEKASARFVTTGYLTENERIDDVARYDDLRREAFSMSQGETSGTIEIPHGVYVIKVLELDESHLPEYDEVADKVKEVVKKSKALQQAKEKAEELLKSLKEGATIHSLAKGEKLTVKESGLISIFSGAFIPGLEQYRGNREGLYTLTKEAPHYPDLIEFGAAFYLFTLKESRDADMKKLEEVKEMIGQRLLTKKREESITAWVEELRSGADIVIFQEAL